MTFTRQDAITFLLGAGAAVVLTVGEALTGLDGQNFLAIDWGLNGFLGNLIVGSGAALGRYIVTYRTTLVAKFFRGQ